ncbi:hypothetical protein L1987_37422 [Smallanthus sonchifolius]|uniref:Uncharacterized protein n=1 Tax=Smallanthus sonchifolius TaxID=185202 RepID=A0ACB9HFW3_9ASTR|nr:hypothetical protein L1987_37422 [Smallanthus sonchifolius]
MDLYLSEIVGDLGLVTRTTAMACFHLASKVFEQIDWSLKKWCSIFDLRMEPLKSCEFVFEGVLKGNIKIPTVFTFLEFFKGKMNLVFSEYPTDIIIHSLKDSCFLRFLPSKVDVALMCVFSSNLWSDLNQYTDENVDACVGMFKLMQRRA